jgi:hypothetical protein
MYVLAKNPSRMARVLWLVLLCMPGLGWAQANQVYSLPTLAPPRYVLLPDSSALVHHVVARRSGEGYIGITPATVEIFNILLPLRQVPLPLGTVEVKAAPTDTLLISLSVLPYANGTIVWEPVRLDTIPPAQVLSVEALAQEARRQLEAFYRDQRAGKPEKRSLLTYDDLLPVVHRQGRYWVPRPYVLTEYFLVRPGTVHTRKQADMATIDVQSPVFDTEAILSAARRTDNPHAQLYAVMEAGNFLLDKGRNRYEFWSNPGYYESHASSLLYGIGRFLYQPGVGLVSSNYKEYFSRADRFTTEAFLDVISIDGKLSKSK